MEKELLKQLRKIQIKILDVFVEICETHKLTYWLDGGTLLGAIRHQGFIPWDDDIDLAMPVNDYKLFLKIAQKELPKDIFLQTSKTDKGYKQSFSKLRDNNSTFIEINELPTSDYHQGIYIDIFPMVRYPLLPTFFLHWLVKIISKTRYKPYVLKNNSFKYKFTFLIANFFWLASSLIKSNYYANFPEDNGYNLIHSYKKLFPLAKVNFEGKEYNAPGYTSDYLIDLYGENYLILPPKEKQITHAAIILPNTPCKFISLKNNI